MAKRVVLRWICALISVFLAWAPSLLAQSAATGALSGTVTDPSGALVPSATVTATSLSTGQARTTTTGSDGTYKISLLPPGNYRVRFEAAGFKIVEVPSATVSVTETEVLDRKLDVGTQTQTVTVESSVETVQTENSALGTVASARVITELPLNTRNYTNLLAMSAGANASVTNAAYIGKGATFIAVNGGGTAQNTYLQDGVPINNWFSFNTGGEGVEFGSFAIPIPDAIAEFKIQTSTYDAGYGRNPGANVNVITKSGSNNFHGSAFEFFRNTALNANDWFRNFNGQPKALFNSNQYGGAVGGPIKKDKLFFFVSYQETSQTNGITGYGTSSLTLPPLPTGDRGSCPAGWNGNLGLCTGNAAAFIQNLATNSSPGAPCNVSAGRAITANSVQVLCPASNPAGGPLYNINPVAISLLQLKLPNGDYLVPSPGAGKFTPTTFTDPAQFKDHNGMGNFDYVFNSKHTLSGRYAYEQDPINGAFPALNVTQITNAVPGHPVLVNKFNHAALLRLTSVLTPNLVNEVRISYQRNNTVASVSSPFTNSGVGITSLTAAAGITPAYDTLSNFMVGSGNGGFSFGPYYLFNGRFPENQHEWADQVSWTHGKHTFRAGFEAERVGLSRNYFGLQAGGPTFSSFGDFLIGRAGCGTGIVNAGCNGGTASNMSNTGMTSPSPTGGFNYSIRVTDLSGFVQDDFKLNSRLTVNVGVRWEYDGLPYLTDGNFSNYLPSLALTGALPTTPATGTLAGFIVPSNYSGPITSGLTKNSNRSAIPGHAPYSDFAPRIGFAWQPTASNRWVVRGGAGYFYDLVGGVLFADNNPGNTAPGVLPTAVPPSSATLANPWVLPSVVIPGAAGTVGFTPLWVNPANNTSSNMAQQAVQENLTVPLTYEWNLNTQYEFVSKWVLELGYVGSHGIHQLLQSAAGFQGQGSATPFNIAQLAGTGAPCTSCPIYNVTTNTPQNVVLRVPNLGISPTASSIETAGSYKYNSLQVTVRKQLSYGLQLQGAYTWSRGFITQSYGLNTYPYFVLQYGQNPNYRPQRFVLSYVWDLPSGHPRGIEGVLLDGWSWSGVTTIQDGNPLNISDATAGSDFVGGNGFASATPQFCPGMSNDNIATSGSLTQRVTSGLTGGPGYLNGKAQGVFCAPPTGGIFGPGTGFGNVGLGVILGPGQNNWDMSLAKSFSIREGQTLQFRSEFFNAFNHPQFSLPNTVASAASGFGVIATTSVSPRIIQLALKYSF